MAEANQTEFPQPARKKNVLQHSRRERKKERTRQEIYTAAMELFVSRGFETVTIEEICQAADVAKGTFFLHFPAKDSLLLEYGSQVTAELNEALRTQSGGAKDALSKMLDLLTERAMRHADIVRLVVQQITAKPRAIADTTEQSPDILHLLTDIVQRGQLEQSFRKEIEPRLAAGIIAAAYLAIVTEWIRCGGNFGLAGAVQQSLHVVLYGLSNIPKQPRKSPKHKETP